MPVLIVTDREGAEHKLNAKMNSTVMETIRDGGIDELLALCGGSCSCATCHVYVDDDWIGITGTPLEEEGDLLDSSEHRKANSRLSCQIPVTAALDGLQVTIAPED